MKLGVFMRAKGQGKITWEALEVSSDRSTDIRHEQ